MLKLGTKTDYGIVIAIGWVGERYYWMIKCGVISMIPASMVENEEGDGQY